MNQQGHFIQKLWTGPTDTHTHRTDCSIWTIKVASH